MCTFPSPLFEMTENHFWVSAHLPHPFKPNEIVQVSGKNSGNQECGGLAPLPTHLLLGLSLVVRPARPKQTFLAQQLPRCLLPQKHPRKSAPSAAVRDGILRPMRTASIWAPTPAAIASLLVSSSCSHPPPPPDQRIPTTPPVSLPPGFQSPPTSDADFSLAGFRAVDCPLRLPVDG